jgi:hypothetical protein
MGLIAPVMTTAKDAAPWHHLAQMTPPATAAEARRDRRSIPALEQLAADCVYPARSCGVGS